MMLALVAFVILPGCAAALTAAVIRTRRMAGWLSLLGLGAAVMFPMVVQSPGFVAFPVLSGVTLGALATALLLLARPTAGIPLRSGLAFAVAAGAGILLKTFNPGLA